LWEAVLPAELRELPAELGKGGRDPRRGPVLGAVSFAADGVDRAADDPGRDVSAADV